MARRCVLSGKGVMTGNNVSHANNRTRRRFLPNLRARRLYSETLGEAIRLRIAVATLRTIEKAGGLDAYLLAASTDALPTELVRMRRRLVEAKTRPV
jgi:large subunit ribosomal protein L28